MADEAKAEEAKPAPMIFKGVCKDGVLKGKEIEGKLDIKVNVESVKAAETPPKKSKWEEPIFWAVSDFVFAKTSALLSSVIVSKLS